MRKSKILFIAGLLTMVVFMSSPAWAISIDPFRPGGRGGSVNGQVFTIGPGGTVFQFDSFLNITGSDLNGVFFGTSALLGADTLPLGLDFAFMPTLSADTTDLTLTYMFTNNTGGILPGVQFLSFLNADIDVGVGGNTFFDEFGMVVGSAGAGAADPDPDSFEIDEPGFSFGDINDNIQLGALDNTNAVPIGSPDDVSLALGFDLGDLNPLDKATINILISEYLSTIGSLALLQLDSVPQTLTSIVMSGQANVEPIPEPATMALFGIGMVGLAGAGVRRRFKKEKKQLK